MTETKIINLEKAGGPLQEALDRLLSNIPENQKADSDLRRLIAFRLQIDGESRTALHLKNKLRAAEEGGFTGRLFDFIRNDREEKACGIDSSEVPDEIG